ncbi:MAG: hypothetical protein AB7E80_00415 [Hyphomicrobiaceae bacterium]
MKAITLAIALAAAASALGMGTANADTFAVHGYQGTNYGGR